MYDGQPPSQKTKATLRKNMKDFGLSLKKNHRFPKGL
jgi:hypothetical protein